MRKKTWEPEWMSKKRAPTFNFLTLKTTTKPGLNKYLWGTTPAFDHVQLAKNEGTNWDRPLALCFAGEH